MRFVFGEEVSLNKEAFLKLKREFAEAEAAFVTRLTVELSDALEFANKTLEARFAAVIKQWEEDVSRAKEEREKERKAKCTEWEAIYLGEKPYPSDEDGKPAAKANVHEVVLRNGVMSSGSTKGKKTARHKGFHATMGVVIDESNKVVEPKKGSRYMPLHTVTCR